MMAKRSDKAGKQPGPEGEPDVMDKSSVYARGQTVIPKLIREALAIEYGTKLHWEVREGVIHVMPIPKNPVQALRGILKGHGLTVERVLEERKAERKLELEREKRLLS